jgi:hypothetical protein
MRKLFTLVTGSLIALALPVQSAHASNETPEAREVAARAADLARYHASETFGDRIPGNGKFFWQHGAAGKKVDRVVVSLSDQLAFAYAGEDLVGVSTISSGKDGHDTPTGMFSVLDKQRVYHSRKYDNAPMPFMQRIDNYGIALHAGHLPGEPASHGCVRLPKAFAAKLFAATMLGTEVLIGT